MELTAKELSFSYGDGGRQIFQNISFRAGSTERVGLMAGSGFGKTTLCRILAGYERPQSGAVYLDEKPLLSLRGKCPVQMIFQHPEQSVDPVRRMGHVLKEGGVQLEEMTERLGIRREWLSRYPRELSGGELQRFCIARALGEGTRFILADEISTMLDLATQKEIWLFLLEETRRRGIGLIAVSHSEGLLREVCTRIMRLERGRAVPLTDNRMEGSIWM